MDIQSRTIISPQKHQDIKIPFHPTLIKQNNSTSKGRILKKYHICAEPALPIGESLVFFLRTAAASHKGLLWAYFLTVWNFDTRTVEEGYTLKTFLPKEGQGWYIPL